MKASCLGFVFDQRIPKYKFISTYFIFICTNVTLRHIFAHFVDAPEAFKGNLIPKLVDLAFPWELLGNKLFAKPVCFAILFPMISFFARLIFCSLDIKFINLLNFLKVSLKTFLFTFFQ